MAAPAAGPRPTLVDRAPGVVVTGVLGAVACVAGALIQVAGRTASLVTGHGWAGPAPVSGEFAGALFTGGPANVWPDVPATAVYVALGAYVVGAAVVTALVWHRLRVWRVERTERSKDPAQFMAGPSEMAGAGVTLEAAQERVRKLRPSLAQRPPKEIGPEEAGWPIGVLRPVQRRQVQIRGSWEDVAVEIMAPRSGKTTAGAVPTILEAPAESCVVATSNKPDVWAATSELRHQRTGEEPWVFDVEGIVGLPQTWWWDPLEDVDDWRAAKQLARHFMVSGGDDHGTMKAADPFWEGSGEKVLASLILAAAVGGKSLRDVWRWLNEPSSGEPSDLLRKGGHSETATGLDGMRTGPVDTRGGQWQNAAQAASCLQDARVRAWVAPERPPGRRFDPATFVKTPGSTLYLLSKDESDGPRPIVAALTERVLKAGEAFAERQRYQRLDPPLVCVLDEAANICRIPELPKYMSHFGSRGIVVRVILQSRPQGRMVWGRDGFDAMWSAATIKIIGSGIDDAELQAELSTMIGVQDVNVGSVQHGRGLWDAQGPTHSETVQQRKIMEEAAIRAVPKGTALLLVTGVRPALVQLQPWYEGPMATEIEAAIDRANNRPEERYELVDDQW